MLKSQSSPLPAVYDSFLQELKDRIRTAQVRAALSVNRELVVLYWSIGRDILSRQKTEGWGAKIIDRLSEDLAKAFPEMRGFRARNLKYMRAFAEAYPDQKFVQQVVAQLPWGHQVRILDSVKDAKRTEWYIRQAVQSGWSRNVLVHQIHTTAIHERTRSEMRLHQQCESARRADSRLVSRKTWPTTSRTESAGTKQPASPWNWDASFFSRRLPSMFSPIWRVTTSIGCRHGRLRRETSNAC
jgi:predicted nuclease of restriction endonuclease-like (RecB) superfamily